MRNLPNKLDNLVCLKSKMFKAFSTMNFIYRKVVDETISGDKIQILNFVGKIDFLSLNIIKFLLFLLQYHILKRGKTIGSWKL